MDTTEIDGITLEYEVRGDGEPVALIHFAPYPDSFLPLMDHPTLAAHQLVRYRRRGYGRSSKTQGPVTIADQAADLAGLLRYLGIERAHIAGHSYGGNIALQLAADHRELVGSLVLMEPALLFWSAGPGSQDLMRRFALAPQRYRDGDPEGAVKAFYDAVFAPSYRELLDRTLPTSWWAETVRHAGWFFGTELPAIQEWQFGNAEAERIRIPVLSMVGALSHPARLEMEHLLRAWLPQLETTRIAGADHLLHLREADLVAGAIAGFLARHPLSLATPTP